MNLTLPPLGFGAAGLGNLFDAVTSEEARATVAGALSAGIRYFDTAPFYGFGLSERRLGDMLRERDDWLLSTKVGRLLRPSSRGGNVRHGFASPMPFEPVYDYSYDGVMRSYEHSLQRLGLGRIDMLLIHDIGEATHGAEASRHWQDLFDGGYRALDTLRAAGDVQAIGLGVNETAACLTAMDHGDYDLFLLAGRYSLLEQQSLAEFLPKVKAAGIGVVAGGVFHSGILATGTRGTVLPRHDYGPASADIVARVARIEAVCDPHGVDLAAAALQFPGRHPAIISTLVGIRSVSELNDALRWYAAVIPDAFWTDLKAQGLMHADAPVA